MTADPDADFDRFASAFVRAYWSTIKDGTFLMPPDEPVEESLDDLLSSVSYAVEPSNHGNRQFRMTGDAGDWWRFGFDCRGGVWELTSAAARSDKTNSPHDLLDEVYAPHFRPFLDHVTNHANDRSEQGAAGQPATP
ncbi:MAG: hypothetical protein AAGA96_18480 [Verrucomicrobiota bacterium]